MELNRFKQLLESTMGNVKPLIMEDPITTTTTTNQSSKLGTTFSPENEKSMRGFFIKFLIRGLTASDNDVPSSDDEELMNMVCNFINNGTTAKDILDYQPLTFADFNGKVSKDLLPFNFFNKRINLDEMKKLVNDSFPINFIPDCIR